MVHLNHGGPVKLSVFNMYIILPRLFHPDINYAPLWPIHIAGLRSMSTYSAVAVMQLYHALQHQPSRFHCNVPHNGKASVSVLKTVPLFVLVFLVICGLHCYRPYD